MDGSRVDQIRENKPDCLGTAQYAQSTQRRMSRWLSKGNCQKRLKALELAEIMDYMFSLCPYYAQVLSFRWCKGIFRFTYG
ncbi:hypothetical protein FJZ33_06020 [Candidatus Poribacteria bacterium]|nr:hypothetical protein [Candidatus Poribacteria bacterium]